MYEVELKARADHERLRERLATLGADALGTVTQVDTYYDAPNRDFASTDEALRIRRERDERGETVFLTYKGPRVDETTKTRQEAETAVEDSDATRTILSELGFQPAATVHKERERYALDESHVTLDSVRDLGEFVEVEYSPDGGHARDADSDTADGNGAEEVETAEETGGDDGHSATGTGADDVDVARKSAVATLERLGLDSADTIRTSYLGLLLENPDD